MSTRHLAGLGAWLAVVALLVLGAASRATLARPFYWSAGLVGGLSLWSAISAFWSGSTELSAIEADRVLVYLGVFIAAFLLTQTDRSRQRFAEGLTISLLAVAVLGLGSRLLPEIVDVANGLGGGAQLRYPFGYWNANGVAFGTGVAMLLWASRRASWAWMRWVSAAAIPALLLALYFTYSRGGVLSLAVACGVLLALSRDRLWLGATLGGGLLGALPAVLAVQGRSGIAENIDSQATVDQGVTVLLFLLGGVALALAVFAATRWAEDRGGAAVGRAVQISRDASVLRWAAVGLAVVGIAFAGFVGSRAWDRFSESDVQFADEPAGNFSDLSGAGRADFYGVALDAFGEEPVRGIGAGTYEFAWERLRSIDQAVHDAHSLYLEAFAELGVIGGLLVFALVGSLLWTGFAAWRHASGRRRETLAALLAVAAAVAVAMAFDWFWEIPAAGGILFLATAPLVAERCRQLAAARRPGDSSGEESRFGLALGLLALSWLAAVALIGPLLVDRALDASREAAARGDYADAANHAETARSIETFAASPYEQLGLIAEAQGDLEAARRRFTQAIDREDRNWQLYYLRARVELAAGDDTAARSDLKRARELNPRAPELQPGAAP